MGGENPLSEECLNGSLKGASAALVERGAQPFLSRSSAFPVARIVLDSRGYDGICEPQAEAGQGLRFVYLDRTGIPHASRSTCQQANRNRSNLHLRITPFRYVADRGTGQLNAKRGTTSHLKLTGSPNSSPVEREREAVRCEEWTKDLFLGRLTSDPNTGEERFNALGQQRVTRITPMLDRVLAGMRTNLAQVARPPRGLAEDRESREQDAE